MSINQFYSNDATIGAVVEINSERNIKFNNGKCRSIEAVAGHMTDLTVVNINGAPYQAGALPALGLENSVLTTVFADGNLVAVFENSINIRAGAALNILANGNLILAPNANFTNEAAATTFNSPTTFQQEVKLNTENSKLNITNGGKLLVDGTDIPNHVTNFTKTEINVVEGNLTIRPQDDLNQNYISTPRINFLASGNDINSNLAYYKYFRHSFIVTLENKAGGAAIGDIADIAVEFVRVGRLVTIYIPSFVFTYGQAISIQGVFKLVANPQTDALNPFKPNLFTLFNCYVYDEKASANPSPGGGIGIYIGTDDLLTIRISRFPTGYFDMEQNKKYGLGASYSFINEQVPFAFGFSGSYLTPA